MSLQLTVTDKTWVSYANAYFKINSVALNKRLDTGNFVINFRYFVYKNWIVLDSNLIDNWMFMDIPVDITLNIFQQAYDYLKTLPKFINAKNI